MDIYLYNTLTKKKELFTPITPGKISMYNCGLTVYNYAHIGNLRSYFFADVLRRMFEFNNFEVTQIVNITDIGHLSSDSDEGEDKMTKALAREGKPLTLKAMREVADFYYEKFLQDLAALNIQRAKAYPFASDNVQEDIDLISKLMAKGNTYTTSDGIYFDTSTFPAYGKLGGGVSGQEHRIAANPEKKDARDFAVWKFNKEFGYDAPFGKGFPGWHIECSAMSMKYLGETFDIHTGGVDHIPVHHNNEIAQSESATGQPFAHYWMHNDHITISGDKMAKSGGNFFTLSTLIEQGISPLAYRYWLLQAKYNTRVDFSKDALEASQKAYNHLVHEIAYLPDGGTVSAEHISEFTKLINDDLNTPLALAFMWKILDGNELSDADKKATVLKMDTVLGLQLDKVQQKEMRLIRYDVGGKIVSISVPSDMSEEVVNVIKAREIARVAKDWKTSDELRDQLNQQGYKISDSGDGILVE